LLPFGEFARAKGVFLLHDGHRVSAARAALALSAPSPREAPVMNQIRLLEVFVFMVIPPEMARSETRGERKQLIMELRGSFRIEHLGRDIKLG
jgi:hypothetical protein